MQVNRRGPVNSRWKSGHKVAVELSGLLCFWLVAIVLALYFAPGGEAVSCPTQ